jgi:hypothetical protein
MAEQSTYPTAPGKIKYPELPGDVPPSYEETMAGGAGKKFQIKFRFSEKATKTCFYFIE